MTDEEFVGYFGQLYERVLSSRSNDDYVVNKPQMNKFIEVLNFFLDTARSCDGKVEPINLTPKEEHGGVTATFLVFDVHGEEIQRFCDVMRHVSAITIDGTIDGICISVTVPKVFVPIEK